MKVNPKQMQAVLALSPERRFEHFVKVVTDQELVWGLYHDGWAMAADDDGVPAFPLWPREEYAELNAIGEWESFTPKSISLADLMGEFLPGFQEKQMLPCIFLTPGGRGLTPTVEQLREAINAELQRY